MNGLPKPMLLLAVPISVSYMYYAKHVTDKDKNICRSHRSACAESDKLHPATSEGKKSSLRVPTREECLKRLNAGEEFDLLIIGGGATGAGAALDAAARGLNVALVEREDFSSGTSSRSTKLIWAGSRYLVQALVNLFNKDLRLLTSPIETVKKFSSEMHMVMNCHRERKFLLETQPHLTNWIPIAVPITRWILWPPPFDFAPAALGPIGLFPLFFKMYDMMGGFASPPSHIMSKKRGERKYPQLNNDALKYCSIFYEGQHDDSRTNLAIALTAAQHGASIANYCSVVGFLRNDESKKDKITGAVVSDELTGDQFSIRAKSVVFCAGPFTDELRNLEVQGGDSQDPIKPAVRGASGIHIMLPSYYAPQSIGLVDMQTSDGRFMFLLPWQGHVLVGTTDKPCPDISMRPVPAEDQIQWLLKECSKYLNPELKVRREDVLSAWSGIRPLAMDPNASNTAAVSRDHIISYNPKSEAIFVSGGKWTTYREMAQDLVDKVLSLSLIGEEKKKLLKPCETLKLSLLGKEGYSTNLPIRLVQDYGVSTPVANRLAGAYAGLAPLVCDMIMSKEGKEKGLGSPLLPGHPYVKAEVIYAVRNEWACTAEDIIARRTRLAFLDKNAALRAIPIVVDIMGDELKWSAERRRKEISRSSEFMKHFGGPEPNDNVA